MACAICEVRRPRRFCPGVNGEICTICCGTEREVTVSCPLECEYLQEAHRRERRPPLTAAEFASPDIDVSERFVDDNVDLLEHLVTRLLGIALETGAIDADVREALAALARTYRSLASGLYYDTRPVGSFAVALYDALQNAIGEFRAAEQREAGVTHTRDADVLGVIVFLQRIEQNHNNGRPRGRAFVDWLRRNHGAPAEEAPAGRSSLFLP